MPQNSPIMKITFGKIFQTVPPVEYRIQTNRSVCILELWQFTIFPAVSLQTKAATRLKLP